MTTSAARELYARCKYIPFSRIFESKGIDALQLWSNALIDASLILVRDIAVKRSVVQCIAVQYSVVQCSAV